MSSKPSISVVMPAFNASSYIDDAIKGILVQTFCDFEFIIINDGSTDDTLKKIKQLNDRRIVIIDQPHMGLVNSLNTGINMSRADIIARQDADDFSLPKRLEVQYAILKKIPTLVLIGTSIITINEKGDYLNQHRVLIHSPELKQELLVRSPFAHGSVMFRKNTYTDAGGYRIDDWPSEDYGLWVRMSDRGEFANIDEPLYQYRENQRGISTQNAKQQHNKKEAIQLQAWQIRYRLTPKVIDVLTYRALQMGEYRIERIARNVLYVIRKSLTIFELPFFIKNILLIKRNHLLFRKCIRIISLLS